MAEEARTVELHTPPKNLVFSPSISRGKVSFVRIESDNIKLNYVVFTVREFLLIFPSNSFQKFVFSIDKRGMFTGY